ncbi:hypothetical protein GCM10009098_22300 [Rheinheimera aquimaris]|uniref:Big-1 domain-containing protein n=1 Tax=Rheinheimera aquimaris TaxID=412437 RepID=A0ABN1DWD8_9GAMM|nr:Ig-like domain-containing protein [Rheinheimera aquimaris]MCB5213866.1 Ig-like domain-containing protein [Rheinheimera aquimaris]
MRNIQQLLVALIVTTLAACGGGGTLDSDGGNGGGNGNTPVYTLSLALSDPDGELAQASPLTITATLTATNNGVVSGRQIDFELNKPDLATFSNTKTTEASARTNSNGVATITLLAGSISDTGTVTASYGEVTADATFTSAGDGGDQPDVTIGSLTLLADKLQLGSGGTDKVELYALVKDSRNVLLSGVDVTFSTAPTGALGGELEIVNGTTGSDGLAVAVLKSQVNPSLRNIAVTAQVGDQSETVTVNVVGTSIDVSAPEALVVGASRTVSILVRDFAGNALPNQPLTVTSSLGNALSSTTLQTNNVGQAEVVYTATNSGRDTVSVSGLGLTQVVDINISADEFNFTEMSSSEVQLNTPAAVKVKWAKNGIVQANQTVAFVVTRGSVFDPTLPSVAGQTEVSVTTDAVGEATVSVQSDTAGFVTIRASAGGNDELITAQLSLEFVATAVDTVEVQASPSQLGVNEQSSVRAIVRDSKNNPVKGKTVNFTLTGSAGGSLNPASSVTNSQGIASTIYSATSATGANGASVTANVEGKTGNTSLTVGERTLFFRFGTGNTVEEVSPTLLRKDFSVVVTDASGNPVANQALNISVTPVTPENVAVPKSDEWAYVKGRWVMVPNEEDFEYWAPQYSYILKDEADPADYDFNIVETNPNFDEDQPVGPDNPQTITKYGYYTQCQNEDANLNGVLDDGEDVNSDGFLTPGNVVTVQQQETSDTSGVATFSLTYPVDYAAWTHVNITVSALASGTENRNSRKYILSYPSSYVTNKTATPARNPFGSSSQCGDTF